LAKQLREAFNNFVGKSSTPVETIGKYVDSVLNKLVEENVLCNYSDIEISKDEVNPDILNVSFNWIPGLVPNEVRVSEDALPVWIEIKEDWHIYLLDIPETKSLSQALFEYFDRITPDRWSSKYGFVRLECANCGQNTIYHDLQDIPLAYGNCGTIDCPHCKTPWLTYSYKEEPKDELF